MKSKMLLLAMTVMLGACYHVTVETGLAPSNQVVSTPWAHSFVGGLVPPSTVDAASKCKNGVARVETQHSFLNSLVAILTSSLYTPVQIDVTCAEGAKKTSLNTVIPQDQTEGAVVDAVNRAVALSIATGEAVFIEMQ